MRLLRLELVTADGRPASRLRALARTALAWAPVLILVLITISAIVAGEISGGVSLSPQAGAGRGAEPYVTFSSPYEMGRGIGYTFARAGATGLLLWLTRVALLVLLGGAIVAIVNPARGIQDRLAGTWIVPR